MDDRYEVGTITSRLGLKQPACPFDVQFDFFAHIIHYLDLQQQPDSMDEEKSRKERVRSRLACILIDESQFLTRSQVHQLTRLVDELNIPVLCYGLRTDFRGEVFEGSKYLLAWADEVSEIKTICWCGRKATFQARTEVLQDGRVCVVKSGAQICIGGNERYVSLCRQHFMSDELEKSLSYLRSDSGVFD